MTGVRDIPVRRAIVVAAYVTWVYLVAEWFGAGVVVTGLALLAVVVLALWATSGGVPPRYGGRSL